MSSFNVINSGLDVQSIVDQLIEVERAPIRRLQRQSGNFESRVKALQSLNSKLSVLLDKLNNMLFKGETGMLSIPASFSQRLAKSVFASRKASSTNESAVAVTAANGAALGSYALTVTSLARVKTSASANFADTDTSATGTGTLVIQVGSRDPVTITVDESNNTLAGVRDAINAANAGVSASIINDGSSLPYRLLVTSNESGTANAFTITENLAGGQVLDLVETQPARDAEFTVNGISLTKSSNVISDVISGVTFSLKATTTAPVEITVEKDTQPVVAALKDLIDAYNEVNAFANAQSRYDPERKTAGVLSGNSTLRSTMARIRNIFTKEINSSYSSWHYVSQLGIRFNSDGSLSLNEAKLQSALDSDSAGVAALFLGEGTAGTAEGASVSDPRLVFNARTAATQTGTYAIEITGLARYASVAGAHAVSTLNQDETLTITHAGTQAVVNLLAGDDLTTVLSRINAALAVNGVPATAADDGTGRIEIATSGYGSGETITVVSDVDSLPGTTGFGMIPVSGVGVDIAGTINGNVAVGSGLTLTGASGNPEEGLSLTVNQTVAGSYGTVTISAAIPAGEGDNILVSLRTALKALTDPLEGPIHLATDGLNGNVRAIARQISEYEERLEVRRERLLLEYARADQALRLLAATQNSLSNQIGNLSKITQS